MPDISKTSEQSLNNILNKLGVKTQEEAAKGNKKTALGQEAVSYTHLTLPTNAWV